MQARGLAGGVVQDGVTVGPAPRGDPHHTLLSALSPRGTRGHRLLSGLSPWALSSAATLGDGLLRFPHSHLFLAPKLS